MSDSRQSSRTKKTVCYSKFGDEEDSDDDFARATPPPSKRSKLEKKNKLSKTNRSKEKPGKTETKQMSSKTTTEQFDKRAERSMHRIERIPPGDKLFDREMQLALEISMHESEGSQPDETTPNDQPASKMKNTEAQIHLTGQETENSSASGSFETITSDNKENQVVKTTKPAPTFPEPDDEIVLVESLDEDEVLGGRRKRKAAKAAVAKQRSMASQESDGEEEAEFKVESDDASSESDGGDADSDYEEFTSSKKKTKSTAKGEGKSPKPSGRTRKTRAEGKKTVPEGKPKPTPTRKKVTTSSLKTSTPVTPLARRPQPTGPVRGFTPPGSSGITGVKESQHDVTTFPSPLAVKRSTWSSPSSSSECNPLGGVKLVSPNQHIRLGLSRNVRIKPLHPNAKVI